jgi:hypothetical protein
MNRREGGFTIVESIIVLAVTAMMFVALAFTFSIRQHREEFIQSMRDTDSKVQDVINDVSTGFSSSFTNTKCSVVGFGPAERIDITANPTETLGQNGGCIYLCKMIAFQTGSDSMKIYTVVGKRTKFVTATSRELVSNLADAAPEIVDGSKFPVSFTEDLTLPAGVTVRYAKASTTNGVYDTTAVGFFPDLSTDKSSSTRALEGLAYPLIDNAGVPLPLVTLENCVELKGMCNDPTKLELVDNTTPPGWYVCFDSGTTSNQHALLTVSGSKGSFATKLDFNNALCS